MTTLHDPNVEAFQRDALERGGYVYTSPARLSQRLATQRTIDLILQEGAFKNRNVLDVGCGDGYYTLKWFDHGKPRALTAVDAAPAAVDVARSKCDGRPITFQVADACQLPWPADSFDLVLLQSILHHSEKPETMIAQAFRVAPEVLIHEPNGYSPGLKVIEKLSPYHRAHQEKSYTSRRLYGWIAQAGGRVVSHRYGGFVPMFCPDAVARTMKCAEPLVEATPLLRQLGCAVVVIRAKRIFK